MSDSAKGVLLGIATYAFWGTVAPIYFKLVDRADPPEILAHRILWSVVMLLAVITVLRKWPPVLAAASDMRAVRILACSAVAVALNWYTYIWAVTHNRLIEASLGYFINPLVSVLLGFAFPRERLRTVEWLSIALATAAVVWLTVAAGVSPWISLTVAFSFGLYGLLRKIAGVASLNGLTIETVILLPLAAGYLIYRAATGTIAFGHISHGFDLLLMASGPVTAIPLLWFAAAVRRLRLATIGLLQYISPTLQFLVAVLIFHEPFDHNRMLAFVLIWIAVAIYSASNVMAPASLPRQYSQPSRPS